MRSLLPIFVLVGLGVACTQKNPAVKSSQNSLNNEGTIAHRVFSQNVDKIYKGKPVGFDTSKGECYVFAPKKEEDLHSPSNALHVYFGKDLADMLVNPEKTNLTRHTFRVWLDDLKRAQLFGQVTTLKGSPAYAYGNASTLVHFSPESKDALTSVELKYHEKEDEGANIACSELKEISPEAVADVYKAASAPLPGESVTAESLTNAFEKECLERAQEHIGSWLSFNTEEGFWGASEVNGGFHKILINRKQDSSEHGILWYIEFQYSTAVADKNGQLGTWAIETAKKENGYCGVVDSRAKLIRRVEGKW